MTVKNQLAALSEALDLNCTSKLRSAVSGVFGGIECLKGTAFVDLLTSETQEGFVPSLCREAASFARCALQVNRRKPREVEHLLVTYANSLSILVEKLNRQENGKDALEQDEEIVVLNEQEVLETKLKAKCAEIQSLKEDIEELFRHYTEESTERERMGVELKEAREMSTSSFDDLKEEIRNLKKQLEEKEAEIGNLNARNKQADETGPEHKQTVMTTLKGLQYPAQSRHSLVTDLRSLQTTLSISELILAVRLPVSNFFTSHGKPPPQPQLGPPFLFRVCVMLAATSTTRTGCPILLLLQLLIQFTASVASGIGSIATLRFDPVVLHDLPEDHNRTVTVIAEFDRDGFAKMGFERHGSWMMKFDSLDQNVALCMSNVEFFNSSAFEQSADGKLVLRREFQVVGNLVGKTGVQVALTTVDENGAGNHTHREYMEVADSGLAESNSASSTLDVWVTRNEHGKRLTKVFVSTLIVLITVANILMGCELDLNIVWETVKTPVAPAIGFCTQFLIMPTLAYIIAQTVFVSRGLSSFALGLFVTACAPGGGASNYWTLLLGGNAHLSITMTFLSTVASLVMMPLWMHLLGKQFLEGYHPEATIRVPYAKIVSSLLALVVPLLIGVGIQKWKPNVAAKAKKVMRPYIICVLIFVIAFGAYANSYMFFVMTVPALIGGLLLPWCGFMFGCFTSILLRQPPANVTAIAIETGIQNTGIAILLLKFSFPEPDADISALIPVIVASFTPAPLLLGMLVHRVIKAMRKGDGNEKDNELGMEKDSSPAAIVHCSSSSLSTRKSYLPKTDSSSTISTRPLVKDLTDCPLLKGAPADMTLEEKMEIVSEILDDVLTPGVVPR